jgi:archaellum component FlaC
MRYTDNYHFDLYEESDNANLMDGYNHSMNLIDNVLQQFNALIITQGNAVKAMDSRIAKLEAACADIEPRIADLEAKVN